MKEIAKELMDVLSAKGSRFADLIGEGLSEEAIASAEQSMGVSFPQELRDYLSIFGGDAPPEDGSCRDVDTQIMQDFICLSCSTSIKLVEMYKNTIVFGEDLFPKRNLFLGRLKKTAFPILTSGAEYISLIWGEGIYAVAWKRNAYGYDSWVWPSIESLFAYMKECWEKDYCRFDFEGDSVDWDAGGAMSLFEKYGVKSL